MASGLNADAGVSGDTSGQEAEERTPPPTAEGAALRAAPHPRCRWRGARHNADYTIRAAHRRLPCHHRQAASFV
ncbi:hypothetical protein [Dickeya fangzhongdai]|uniref:hypothetical protein n=1 Tax=Dickeya fangzhongdai TaxID=1778540 RepID=UPI0026E110A8|nr:hypothetical protein [Dickeya fangzhongdai]WKV50851.1 hypothetical protein PL145_00750 [Dickeya fangzhongdai]